MQTKLMFLPEDSHVNHIQAQESDLAKKMNAIYGPKCLDAYERLPRVTSWAKMFAALLIGMEGWYSTKCVLTWKILGIKSRPLLYLRARSMRHINEREFGLLPTPLAQCFEQINTEAYDARMQRIKAKGHTVFTMPLDQMAIRGILPTPTAMDYNMTYQESKEWKGMLPTPQAQDHKASANQNQNGIGKMAKQAGNNSQLNPRFVAEMMGFPPNWTELPFQNGAMNQ
jgi:hypothetical protein